MIRATDLDTAFAVPASRARTPVLATRLLHGCLFLTILVSPLVFIEPSPYEAAAGLLLVACVIAGVKVDRRILPLGLLLLLFNLGGVMSLPHLATDREALTYVAISFYLCVTAFAYACLFAEDSLRRLEIMRRAYLIAALFASLAGIAGYFGIWPDGALYGRARATFKDPNVFGPFLVLPLLFLMQSLFFRGLKLRYLVLFGLLTFGLLLSFSRGAWGHFVFSAAVMFVLTFVTARNAHTRFRLVVLSAAVIIALTGFIAAVLSFRTLDSLFIERAQLTQSYDVGSGGRFDLQKRAVGEVLERPGGMGPHEFERVYGLQQHNVYLQAFLVYGWLGGLAFITLLIVTLLIGLRMTFVITPWQPYLISALAAFCGEVGESFIIDSDHWRHFFLLLGIIWGLIAATVKARAQPSFEGHAAAVLVRP